MGSAGTMGFAAIMVSEAPMCSSGSDRIGLPMPTRRWSSHPLLQSMLTHRHRARPRPHSSIGTIVMTCRATTRLSSSALVAGGPSLRLHHEWLPGMAGQRTPMDRTEAPRC